MIRKGNKIIIDYEHPQSFWAENPCPKCGKEMFSYYPELNKKEYYFCLCGYDEYFDNTEN